MTDAISVWIHIIAVSIWIGPQFFLFIVAIPALRTVDDARQRAQLMRTIVTRFGWLAWSTMAVIILSGIGNLMIVNDRAHFDLFDYDYRWVKVFAVKMTLVALTILLTGVHTIFVGPRQLQLAEQIEADPAHASGLHRMSIALSSAGLLASVAAVYCGALLANHNYSFAFTGATD